MAFALVTAALGPGAASGRVLSPWWRVAVRIDRSGDRTASPDLGAVSCASSTLCVATDGFGNMFASTAPAAGSGSWRSATVDAGGDADSVVLGPVSCGLGICATDDRGGNVIASGNPAGGAGAWTIAGAPLALDRNAALSCPTSELCVAVDGDSRILSSTNPASGTPEWSVTLLGGPHVISAVSCPTSSFCVAVDDAGNILSSIDPTGGAAAWTVTPLPVSRYNLWALSCPTASFCAAVDHDSDDVLTSSDPSGGSAAWHLARIMPSIRSSLLDISCTGQRLCVASDDAGAVHTSIDPTAGARAWTSSFIDGVANSSLAGVLRGVSCPTSGLCVAVDQAGTVLTSTDPAGPAVRAAAPTVSHASASLRGARVRLTCSLAAGIPPGAALTGLALSLPRGLTPSRAQRELHEGIVVRGARGQRLATVIGTSSNAVTIRLRQPSASATVSVSSPAIIVSGPLTRADAEHRGKPVTIGVRATDSYVFTTALPVKLAGSR